MDGLVVENTFTTVEVLDKLRDASAVMELVILDRIHTLISEPDGQAFVQKRQLAQPLRQCVVVVGSGIHNGWIGLEGDLGSGLLASLTGLLQRAFGNSAGVFLLPRESVAPDLELQPLGKRVHAAYSDAVQTSGHFIAFGIELTTGMELGHYNLGGGNALFGVHVNRDAATVIYHCDRIVDMNR